MSIPRIRLTDRFLAILLALVMVIGMLPASVYASSTEFPDKFTVTVKDSNGSPVADARVVYTLKVDVNETVSNQETSNPTNSNGIVAIDLSANESDISNGSTVTITVTASKTPVFADETKTDVTVSSVTGNIDIALSSRKVTVMGTVNDHEGTAVDGATVVFSGDNVDAKSTTTGVDGSFMLQDVSVCENGMLTITAPASLSDKYNDLTYPISFSEADTVSCGTLALELKTYSFTFVSNEFGKFTKTDSTDAISELSVKHGKDVSFKFVPNKGFEATVTDGSTPLVAQDGVFSIANVQEAHTITATTTDIQKPSITSVTIKDESTWATEKLIYVEYEDNAGKDGVRIYISQTEYANHGELTAAGETAVSLPHKVSANGTYYVYAVDEANLFEKSSVEVRTVDIKAPTIDKFIPKPTGPSTNPRYEFTVTDDQSGVASVQFYKSGNEENKQDATADGSDGKYFFIANENIEYIVSVTDNAGNTGTYKTTVENYDGGAPSITAVNSSNIWNASENTVSFTVNDNFSIKKLYYSTSESASDGTVIEVSAENNGNGNYKFTVTENGTYYIYAVDDADLVSHVSVVVNHIDKTAPENATLKIADANGTNDWYVDKYPEIKITEPTVSGFVAPVTTYYKLWDTRKGEIENSAEQVKFNGSNHPTISADGTYVLKIWTVDEAGNRCEKKDEIVDYINVDLTKPKIAVSYSNNNVYNSTYFKADRTATIVVTERNFDPKDIAIEITNTDGVTPTLSEWKEMPGTGNLDDTKWTATFNYNAEGDYTFKITSCTDLAGNAAGEANYGDSVAPTSFTIDKTLPTIAVSYDNNKATNKKYFNAPRTATVTIVEHNFDVNRVFARTATMNGANIDMPSISWENNGDTHIATIVYSADGDYTFDATVLDLAGNMNKTVDYGSSVVPKEFTIDQTCDNGDASVIGGVRNGRAYSGAVIPTINFKDVNYSHYKIRLYRTRKDQIDVDITDEKNIRSMIREGKQNINGSLDVFATNRNGEYSVEDDGIYTLEITAYDMAGNDHSERVTFTVNRFGSVYVYESYLASLIQGGGSYVQKVTEDLVITEYNANRLLNDSLIIEITRDGRSIDAKYVANPVPNANVRVGESGWFQYQYTISKDNFAEDGIYHISLSSKDEANNMPESTTDNSTDANGNPIVDTMQFRVDSMIPEITSITGLENSIINEQAVDVRFTVYDAIGLKSVTVYVNGTAIQTVDTFEDFNNYSASFTINESSSEQTVRIVVEDLAGNVTDSDLFGETDAEGNVIVPMPAYSFNGKVTVSTNLFVRWYANKPLFWGSIGGVIVMAGAIWFLIAYLRKKKKDDEE